MVDRGSFSFVNNLTFIDERVRSHAPISKNQEMPENWTPQPWSVLCGRGKDCYEHIGNRRFRLLVDINLPKYVAAKNKIVKSTIVVSILDAIREGTNHVGGFVKYNAKTNRWVEVSDDVSREKIGQQFRVAMQAQKKDTKKTLTNDKPEQSSSRVSKSKMAISRKRTRPVSPETISSIPAVVEAEDSSVDERSTCSSKSEDISSPLPLTDIADDAFTGDLLDFDLDTNEQEEALLHVIAI